MKTAVTLMIFSMALTAADQPKVRASLQPVKLRKKAPDFALADSTGKTTSLKNYRGKVVLLDFWATWCRGCKEEIPWFAEFERRYAKEGLAVVGVSLDDDGWKVIRPFLAASDIRYRILLGDDATARRYGIGNMPDAFLIDRKGRIAATYVGLVDREDVERNIRSLLLRK